jgi:hypothetical protein
VFIVKQSVKILDVCIHNNNRRRGTSHVEEEEKPSIKARRRSE